VWIQPLFSTFQLIAVSVTIAAMIGILGAWGASTLESAGRGGRILSRLFLASMVAALAMPMILHAAAWEATAGKFGWFPLTQTGARLFGQSAWGSFGGLVACGWIHGLLGASLVAVATWHGTRTVPARFVDQAQLERSPLRLWWQLRLPLAMPWWLTALLATALLAATEMTVADLYGFRTVADEFYLYFAMDPPATAVAMACLVPLVLGFALVAATRSVTGRDLAVRRREGVITRASELPSQAWLMAAAGVVISVAILIVLVPVLGLIIKVGHEVQVIDDTIEARWSLDQAFRELAMAPSSFAREYRWTFLLAGLTGLIATGLAWPFAAWGRGNRKAERGLDLASIAMVVIPGPVVGLAVVSFFQHDLPGLDSLYQRTLVPTVIALLFRAGPWAYWVLRAGYRMLDQPLVETSRLDGPLWRRMWSVDRRLLGTSFVVAGIGATVMASGDVPAALPVMPPGVTTVGTRLFGLLHSGARQQEAALALWYLLAVVLSALCGLYVVQSKRKSLRR